MIRAFFWERIRKKYIWQAVFHANILVSPYFRSILRDKTFDCGKENSGDYSLRIIGKFSSEVQNETKPLQDNFIRVPFLISINSGTDFKDFGHK